MLPLIVVPFLVVELETMMVMNLGTVAGGPVSPAMLVQVPPQLDGLGVVLVANPLKLDGVAPPLSEFPLDHLDPQNVTFCPTAAFRSPMTKFTFRAVIVKLADPELPL
jgi:hypothetical protein